MSTPLIHQNTIIKPVNSEKSYGLAALDKYVFRVDPQANKNQIKQAVKDLFKVDVLNVSTVKKASRTVRSMKTGKYVNLPVTKKAIVQIKKGQKIEIFSALNS